jgi:hypothetical protein
MQPSTMKLAEGGVKVEIGGGDAWGVGHVTLATWAEKGGVGESGEVYATDRRRDDCLTIS